MSAAHVVRRIAKDWETEIARPVLVALVTALAFFMFSLLFAPVRRFLFDDTVPYSVYCTAETYSTPNDLTKARTEFLLINTTDRSLSRADLQKELSNGGDSLHGPSPDVHLVYARGIGQVDSATEDTSFNKDKGGVDVMREGQNVLVQPRQLNPRAILRVNIDVSGLDPVEISRAAHGGVPFQIESYEQGCYTR
jgi:hypothetical protein